ncbi:MULTISPECIES: hypothetical protein [unclassified Campylobacter]|uniref:hypothetical protein n=1 Tax=unclassified Campylobacter TaxID=2593542 RepID=UPI00128A8C41|nr:MULTISPECIES: hypothetical protein [unclassified Campylobacter]EAK0818936.1 hypothetical protein [Campylobacter lari]EAK9891416.1 hypothetical protein [Campylobacter lari]MCV3443619.1 hypothetical protein [Campylobacter sp. IFREMER_LSEM_CL1097]MCV3486351.1 hypothetical protein [Campylobacter sp. CNRCH_2014_2452]MCV3509090.1 hypothetical protein [Campylobacter sp. CNRCH_2016_3089]
MIFFISSLTLILCFFNYYFLYPIDQKLFYIYTSISILIFIATCIYLIIKNQKLKKDNIIIQEIEKFLKISSSTSLIDLKEKLKTSFELTQKQLQDQKIQNKLLQKNLQYLIQSFNYMGLENSIALKPILKKYQINTKTKNIIFKNIHACIVNDDMIENFLLQCILLDIGISSEIFDDFQKVEKKYSFIISKKKIKNTLNYTFVDVNVKDLINFLSTNFKEESYQIANLYNVLIFKSSSFENNLILNITNQFCSNNQIVDSLSDFKNALKLNFRLILVDYEVIKFDILHFTQILHEYKIQNSQNKILLFTKNRVKNCDFADEIINDISKNEWIILLKKYINQV